MYDPSLPWRPAVSVLFVRAQLLLRLGCCPIFFQSRITSLDQPADSRIRCNDLTVPYPTGAISLTDPFVDHVHHPLDLEVDEDSCIEPDHPLHPDRSPTTSDFITSPRARTRTRISTSAPNKASGARRRSRYRKDTERARSPHRFPPIFYLPLPWPFGYVGPNPHDYHFPSSCFLSYYGAALTYLSAWVHCGPVLVTHILDLRVSRSCFDPRNLYAISTSRVMGLIGVRFS